MLMFMGLKFVVSAAWTAHRSIGMGIAMMFGSLRSGVRALTRVASSMTEPLGLVLLGVSLIALSWLVARRVQSSKRR